MTRLHIVALALLSLGSFNAAQAQDYPARQVRMIVPFGAGGPADVYARVIAQHLTEQLKQTFIIENRPGAGSIIGTDAVAKSAPDGYTLLVMSNTHTTNESLVANKPFQLMRDFVPVATLNTGSTALMAVWMLVASVAGVALNAMAPVVTVLPAGIVRVKVNVPPVIVLVTPGRLEPNSLSCWTSLSGVMTVEDPLPLYVRSPTLSCVPPEYVFAPCRLSVPRPCLFSV